MSDPVVLYWDIDGTLLTTARAGIFALEDALADVTGVRTDLAELPSSGLTEHQVAAAVFGAAGVEADDALTDRFLRAYEHHLPASLGRRRGTVLPGVREILDDLAGRDDVRSILLTGNTPKGAHAKLAHYELLAYFDEGAYCVGPGSRQDIARRALELAPVARERYVIGDTPHDIDCGKAIGARTVAVATGSHPTDELAAHEPWALLPQLPEPAEFRQLVELD